MTFTNSCLQFQEILVLSKGPSWRTRGLTAAATYSDLKIRIPIQTVPTEELIEAFRALGPSDAKHPNLGQAYNWLAHLDLVKHAIALDLDTFLILEDDADWDVSIKHQMQLISSAVREFTFVDEKDTSPYGRSWDILWLLRLGVSHPGRLFQGSAEPCNAGVQRAERRFLGLGALCSA